MAQHAVPATHRDRWVRVVPALDVLLAELAERRPFKTSDSLSGSSFESARYRGEPVILKYICVDDDWIMRGTGDLGCRVLRLFSSDVLNRLPVAIDHATLAVASYTSQAGRRGAVLVLRDVAGELVPAGDDDISLESHLRFIDHMAALHAAFWGRAVDVELIPLAHHYTFLTPTMAGLEALRQGSDPVPKEVASGWRTLQEAAPKTSAALSRLAADPGPLASALGAGPQTLIHGDWKLGNLGEHADGVTILLDWDRCGIAPATLDLAWYLAVNCDRLPQSKEEVVDAYRDALEGHGIDTAGWWDAQLRLTLLGAALQLAWSKAGDAEELGWWSARVAEGIRELP
jgi:hypothetical protein